MVLEHFRTFLRQSDKFNYLCIMFVYTIKIKSLLKLAEINFSSKT